MCASLFASLVLVLVLVLGTLVLGRRVSLSGRDDVAPTDRTLAGFGIAQHLAFLLGMALVFALIVHAGTPPGAAPPARTSAIGA